MNVMRMAPKEAPAAEVKCMRLLLSSCSHYPVLNRAGFSGWWIRQESIDIFQIPESEGQWSGFFSVGAMICCPQGMALGRKPSARRWNSFAFIQTYLSCSPSLRGRSSKAGGLRYFENTAVTVIAVLCFGA